MIKALENLPQVKKLRVYGTVTEKSLDLVSSAFRNLKIEITELTIEPREYGIGKLLSATSKLEVLECNFTDLDDALPHLEILAQTNKMIHSLYIYLTRCDEASLIKLIEAVLSLDSSTVLKNLSSFIVRSRSTELPSDASFQSIASLVREHRLISKLGLTLRTDSSQKIKEYMGSALEKNRLLGTLLHQEYQLQTEVEYGRAKIMFIGRGGAGKTSTQEHLFHEDFDVNQYKSTVVADAGNVGTVSLADGHKWRKRERMPDWAGVGIREAVKSRPENLDDKEALDKAKEELLEDLKEGNEFNGKRNIMASKLKEEADANKAKPVASLVPVKKKKSQKWFRLFQRKRTANLDHSKVNSMTADEDDGKAYRFSLWDLGGQQVFHCLHHLFFTENSLYIYAINLKRLQDEEAEELLDSKFWLESLKLHAPDSPVLIVGTHMDALRNLNSKTEKKILSQLNEKIEEYLDPYERTVEHNGNLNFFPISNNKDSSYKNNIELIRDAVERIAERDTGSLPYLHYEIPLRWLQFMDYIVSLGDYLLLKKVIEEAKDFRLLGETDLKHSKPKGELNKILEFFNKVGYIIYFPSLDSNANYLVLSPQWLMTMFAKFVMDEKLHAPSKLVRFSNADGIEFTRYFKSAEMSIRLFDKLFEKEEPTSDKSSNPASLSDFILFLGRHLLILATYLKETIVEDKHDKKKNKTIVKDKYEKELMVMVAPIFDTIKKTEKNLAEKEVHFFVKFADDSEWPNELIAEVAIPNGFFCRILCYFVDRKYEYPEASDPSIRRNYGNFPYGTGVNFEVFLDEHNKEIRFSLREDSVEDAARVCRLAKKALMAVFDDIRGEFKYLILCNANGKIARFKQINLDLDKGKPQISVLGADTMPMTDFKHFYVMSEFPTERFDCFLSHCWGEGGRGHKLVKEIYRMLVDNSVRCWFDEVCMQGNIYDAMTKGLDRSNKYVVFITEDLVNRLGNPDNNITKEFDWINDRPWQTRVYVVLDSEYLDRDFWVTRFEFSVPKEAPLIDMTTPEKMKENLEALVNYIKS